MQGNKDPPEPEKKENDELMRRTFGIEPFYDNNIWAEEDEDGPLQEEADDEKEDEGEDDEEEEAGQPMSPLDPDFLQDGVEEL